MKFRISPAAAAVFLAAGLFTSGLRAASAPAAIPFENDAAFNVTLSNTNPSKVVVDGELITSISGPTGAYDQSQTEDGALILSPLVGQNFTLFIQTDHGSSLSLNVRPQPGKDAGVQIDPTLFTQYNITTVPALVVTCPGRYDVIRGSLPLQQALEKVAESGDCAATARHLLEAGK